MRKSISEKQQNTKKTGKKSKKTTSRKIFKAAVLLGTIGVILFFALFFAVFFGVTGHVPTSAQLNKISNPVASEVFSEDGKLLGRYYIENRSHVEFDELPPHLINALIATEDARFYEHRGIDEIALMRVLVKTIMLMDRSSGGGSTISQQLAKNLFPRNNVGILSMPVNKLREAIIAYRLERIYTKEEILTLYLNTVPFGENIFGIEVASERYFSKLPSDLTVDEAAVLVGMLKGNNFYNPRLHPERSEQRRNVVIAQMVNYGYLDPEEGEKYKQKPLEIHYRRISFNEGPAPYFLEMLKPELLDWCARNKKENGDSWNLYTDGLRIVTTLNSDYQRYAINAVTEHMQSLQKEFDNHWNDRDPWHNNDNILQRAIKRTNRYQTMAAAGKTPQQIEDAFNQKIKTTFFTWDGMKEVETTPLDSVKHYLRFLNTGFLALDPVSGDLKAWVGGIDFRFFKYDHVLSKRQTGSIFKPFVFLAGLENGLSPFEYYPAQQTVYTSYDNYSPSNFDGNHEGFYTMEGGLARSVNTVAVDILMKTGIDNVIHTTRELGLSTDIPRVPSVALGVHSESLKDMLFAYATVLNNGKRVEPYYLKSISSRNNEILEEFPRPEISTANLNELHCRLIIHMMESVVQKGTAARIRNTYNIWGDFAGKTGTTQNYADGWFVGITPSLVTGTWVGAEEPGIRFRSSRLGQGSNTALPIVGRFFRQLYSDPNYKHLQKEQFAEMQETLLADLDLPIYKEMLEIERHDFFDRLFAGGDKKEKNLQKLRKMDTDTVESKDNIWQKMKGIFRRK